MQLSIIVPVYKESKSLHKFLEEMQRQELQNFELVIVLDTNIENNLTIIDKYRSFFDNRLSLIYNTRRSGRTNAIYEGVKKSTGEYILISSTSDILFKDAVTELINLIIAYKSDIIEFIPRMRSPIRFKGYLRKSFSQPINLLENASPIAYSFPFDFNKLFKRDVLLKALEDEKPADKFVNTRFAITYVLKTFYYAKTYNNIDKKIIRSKLNHINEISPFVVAKQWEDIRNYIQTKHNNRYLQEFDYLSFYHQIIVLTNFTLLLNKKNLTNKYQEYLDKQIEQYFAPKLDQNKYFLIENNETEAFREAKNFNDYAKLLKFLN